MSYFDRISLSNVIASIGPKFSDADTHFPVYHLKKNDHQGKTIFYLRGSILINLVEKPIYDGNYQYSMSS